MMLWSFKNQRGFAAYPNLFAHRHLFLNLVPFRTDTNLRPLQKRTAQKIAVNGSPASGFANFHGLGCRQNGGIKADTNLRPGVSPGRTLVESRGVEDSSPAPGPGHGFGPPVSRSLVNEPGERVSASRGNSPEADAESVLFAEA